MSTSAAQLYNDIRSFVQESQRYLDEGNHVELEGLDAKVKELCQTIATLPPAEAKAFAEHLQQLLDEINGLAERLVKQRDEIKQSLGALNLHQKANVAYKTSDMMAPKPPKKEEK